MTRRLSKQSLLMLNLNSWLRRTRTFPEQRKTCEKTAPRAPALTLRWASGGATGAGWGVQWDGTEARNKTPNVIILRPFESMVFIHFLFYWQTSTRGAREWKGHQETLAGGAMASQGDHVSGDKGRGLGSCPWKQGERICLEWVPWGGQDRQCSFLPRAQAEGARRTGRTVGNFFLQNQFLSLLKMTITMGHSSVYTQAGTGQGRKGCGSTRSF